MICGRCGGDMDPHRVHLCPVGPKIKARRTRRPAGRVPLPSTGWPDFENDPSEFQQRQWEEEWERRGAEMDWIDPYGDT